MKRVYFIAIAFVVMLISISTVSAGVFDFFGGTDDDKVIKIESEDSSLSGKLEITEYQSYKNNHNYEGGATNDILIENGEAEYKLHDDTKFFKVDFFIEDIELGNTSDDDPMVTVKYLLNNDTILSSSSDVFDDLCDVNFGGYVYSVEGKSVR